MWRLTCVAQFYLLIALYTYLGLTPSPEKTVPVFNDLLMHFAGYAVAAISISFARPYWPLWLRMAFLLAYSIAIEIAQHFNPPRTFSLMDIVANLAGIVLGLALLYVLQRSCSNFHQLLHYGLSTHNGLSTHTNKD